MTLRLRLTLLYGLVFLAAGAGLLAINYALLDHNLPTNRTSAKTGQDVIARAAKLSDPRFHSDLTDVQRQLLKQIAGASPDTAVQLAGRLPKPLAQLLLSALPGDVSAQARSTLLRQSLVALAAGAVIAVALGWYVAGRALRPLRRITATAQQLSHESLDLRIALNGPDDELKQLADTFDEMLARLGAAFAGQRRFVADASHELRTPLTIMRTELDVTLRHPNPSRERLMHMAHVVRDAIDRSEQLVASLLALATSEHGIDDATTIELADALHEALARRAPAATARHIDIDVERCDEELTIEGDTALVERLIDNLLDNAIRHNHDGGSVRLRLEADPSGARLEIANSGPPIAPDAVPPLFEPFHRNRRTGTHREGFGLGLAIVRSIARAHHGDVTATANSDGGLTVVVTLPAHQPAVAI